MLANTCSIWCVSLDDAFLQRPALGAAVLEIQIGVIETVRQHAGKHLFDLVRFDGMRSQQRLLRGGE